MIVAGSRVRDTETVPHPLSADSMVRLPESTEVVAPVVPAVVDVAEPPSMVDEASVSAPSDPPVIDGSASSPPPQASESSNPSPATPRLERPPRSAFGTPRESALQAQLHDADRSTFFPITRWKE